MSNRHAWPLDMGSDDAGKGCHFSPGHVEFEGTLPEGAVLCKCLEHGRGFWDVVIGLELNSTPYINKAL